MKSIELAHIFKKFKKGFLVLEGLKHLIIKGLWGLKKDFNVLKKTCSQFFMTFLKFYESEDVKNYNKKMYILSLILINFCQINLEAFFLKVL